MSVNLRNKISQEVESLTVHGVSRVVKAKTRLEKISWFLLCVAALSFLIQFAVGSLIKHFKKQVYVHVEKKYNENLSLPAITFCNTNIESDLPAPVFQDLPDNCSMLDDKYFKNKVNKKYFQMACKLFFGNFPYVTSKISYTNSESIRFPKSYSFLPSFWPCFTLNRNSNVRQLMPGGRDGLDMILNFDENEYSKISHYYDPVKDQKRGLFINFHDPKVHVYKFDGLFVSPGYHYQFIIRKVVKIRKPKPFVSNCSNNGDENNEMIVPGKPTVANCYFSCFFTKLYHACNGIWSPFRPFMSLERYPENATHPKFAECAAGFWDNITKNTCSCPPPCYEESYEIEASHNPWPQSWQVGYISALLDQSNGSSKRFTIDEIKKRLIKLSFFYEDMIVEVQTEKELYSFSSIVSDFGGQMGLFLGASCLSLVEIILLLVNSVIGLFKRREVKPRDEEEKER